MARGWRSYVAAAMSLGVALIGLVGAMWAIGSASSEHSSGVGASLTTLFDTLFTAAPALIFIPAAMIGLGAAYGIVRSVRRGVSAGDIRGFR